MINLIEIARAFANKMDPTAQEIEIAAERMDVCKECPFRKNIFGFDTCTDCGCHIPTKIFVSLDSEEKCPQNKWKR